MKHFLELMGVFLLSKDITQKTAHGRFEIGDGQAQLLGVVDALNTTGRFTSRLHGRQEQRNHSMQSRRVDRSGVRAPERNHGDSRAVYGHAGFRALFACDSIEGVVNRAVRSTGDVIEPALNPGDANRGGG